MVRLVLFDLDGVLVDACDWHYEALNRALKEIADYEISREDHFSTFNALTTRVKLKMLIEREVLKDEAQAEQVYVRKQELTVKTIEDLAEHDTDKMQLMQDIKDMNCRIGCVTNCIRDTATLMLKKTGTLDFLDILVSNQDVVHPKPHGEPYIRAMIHFGVQPEHVLIVEDSDKGVEAAQAAGVEKIWKVKNATQVTPDNFKKVLESCR